MKVYTIIVAGGTGKRMGSQVPKQFLLLQGKPILMHTVERFNNALPDSKIIIVLPKDQINDWNKLVSDYNFKVLHEVVIGGEERFNSVKNALNIIPENFEGVIAIHDGVRPLVSNETIINAIEKAKLTGASIPVISLTDSIRKIDKDGNSVHQNRADFKMVQTPQCFRASLIKKAYDVAYDPSFTDDASVFEKAGNTVSLVEGNVANIKITTPNDLIMAEAIIKSNW